VFRTTSLIAFAPIALMMKRSVWISSTAANREIIIVVISWSWAEEVDLLDNCLYVFGRFATWSGNLRGDVATLEVAWPLVVLAMSPLVFTKHVTICLVELLRTLMTSSTSSMAQQVEEYLDRHKSVSGIFHSEWLQL